MTRSQPLTFDFDKSIFDFYFDQSTFHFEIDQKFKPDIFAS
jgi:hypothetical protein